MTLRSGQQRELRNTSIRIGDDPLQKHLKLPQHSLDCRRLKQVLAVNESNPQTLRVVGDVGFQVKTGRMTLYGHYADRQVRKFQRRHGRVLQSEGHLKQRVAAQLPLRMQLFHQLLKRHVLVRVSTQRGVAHSRKQLPASGVTGDVGPQHEHVDEEAYQTLDLSVVAVGDG